MRLLAFEASAFFTIETCQNYKSTWTQLVASTLVAMDAVVTRETFFRNKSNMAKFACGLINQDRDAATSPLMSPAESQGDP